MKEHRDTKKSKRGRPALDRDTVQEKLAQIGWTIPEGVKYRGAGELHTLVCTECGHITEKWLHNVVYRGETCPNAANHGKDKIHREGITMAAESITIDYDKLHGIVRETVQAEVSAGMSALEEVILGATINRDDLIEKFNKMFTSTVSRRGYITYGRAMDTFEWFTTADLIAKKLIARLDPDNKTLLGKNFDYHRSKNPSIKPEKVMLMIMSKANLYRALEQLHIVKLGL